MTTEGPSSGYFLNPTKTWMITKNRYFEEAFMAFADLEINILARQALS